MSDPTEEELMASLEEELGKLKIGELLLQTLYTVSSLTYRRLSAADRDLGEARLGIEALRALVPVLQDTIPPQATRDINSVIANLQLAYASAALEAAPATAEPEPAPEPAPAEPPPPPDVPLPEQPAPDRDPGDPV